MGKGFDFDSVGKKMPYTVPDDFFRKFEKGVVGRMEEEGLCRQAVSGHKTDSRKGRAKTLSLWIVAASVACLAVLFTLRELAPRQLSAGEHLANIEKAYDNLADDDKDYILSVYENDLFFNDEI